MDKWISIEDKLPEEYQQVILFYDKKQKGYANVVAGMRASWRKYGWETYKGNNSYTRYVTHWMPLPEPPEENE